MCLMESDLLPICVLMPFCPEIIIRVRRNKSPVQRNETGDGMTNKMKYPTDSNDRCRNDGRKSFYVATGRKQTATEGQWETWVIQASRTTLAGC